MKKSKMQRKIKKFAKRLELLEARFERVVSNLREDHDNLEELVHEFIEEPKVPFEGDSESPGDIEYSSQSDDGDGEGGEEDQGGERSLGARADSGDADAIEELRNLADAIGYGITHCDNWTQVEAEWKREVGKQAAQEAPAPGPDSSVGDGSGLGGVDLLRHPSLP